MKHTNMYLIAKCKTEFGKRNPVNVGIKLVMELNIDVTLFPVFRFYKKIKLFCKI